MLDVGNGKRETQYQALTRHYGRIHGELVLLAINIDLRALFEYCLRRLGQSGKVGKSEGFSGSDKPNWTRYLGNLTT